jgi:hypothetical protein
MRPDHERDRSNRNNWLLIKHRDGFEREGRDPVTEQDRSVASGRNMEENPVLQAPGPRYAGVNRPEREDLWYAPVVAQEARTVPAGPSSERKDAIIYDMNAAGQSASGFGHPKCAGSEAEIADALQAGVGGASLK